MENPATWGEVEKTIDAALDEHEMLSNTGFCGTSVTKRIANALRAKGLVRESVPGADWGGFEDAGHAPAPEEEQEDESSP